jgi:transposase-like protein
MLERLNEEIKRRTRVVRIFPYTNSCLQLIRTLCIENHENMVLLSEQKRSCCDWPRERARCLRRFGLRPVRANSAIKNQPIT